MGNMIEAFGGDEDFGFDDEEPMEPFTDGFLKGKTVSINTRGNRGMAWYVVADDDAGNVVAVMVGDNRRYNHSAEDCTELDEDSVCSCGQLGCGWH